MAAFLLKVFTLTLRTAAKPLAQRFQAFVLTHPTLRPRVTKLAQARSQTQTLRALSKQPENELRFTADTLGHAKCDVICCASLDLSREQVVHRFETRVTRSAEGKTGKVFVGDLSDENALDLAGKLVSEAFLYTVQRPLTPLDLLRASQ